MGSIFGDDTQEQAYVWITLITSVISAIASILVIVIIKRLKSNSGHVFLLLWMSYFQLAYDLVTFTANVDCGYYWTVASYLNHIITGIAATVVSNWMSFIALYIVFYRKHIRIRKHFDKLMFTALFPGIAIDIFYGCVAIPEAQSNDNLIYLAVVVVTNVIRLASISLNFVFIFFILYKVTASGSKGKTRTEEEKAIRTLAFRMIFYPIVQSITRGTHSWYEIRYGAYRNFDDDISTEKFVCMLIMTLSTPIVSVGYLVIFLNMQPQAYKHFRALIFSCDHYLDDGEGEEDSHGGGKQDTFRVTTTDSRTSRSTQSQSHSHSHHFSSRHSADTDNGNDNDRRSSALSDEIDTVDSKHVSLGSGGIAMRTWSKKNVMMRDSQIAIIPPTSASAHSISTRKKDKDILDEEAGLSEEDDHRPSALASSSTASLDPASVTAATQGPSIIPTQRTSLQFLDEEDIDFLHDFRASIQDIRLDDELYAYLGGDNDDATQMNRQSHHHDQVETGLVGLSVENHQAGNNPEDSKDIERSMIAAADNIVPFFQIQHSPSSSLRDNNENIGGEEEVEVVVNALHRHPQQQ